MLGINHHATQLDLLTEEARHKVPSALHEINGWLNGDNLHITQEIDALTPRHLKECLLGTPHNRRPMFISSESRLTWGEITLRHP